MRRFLFIAFAVSCATSSITGYTSARAAPGQPHLADTFWRLETLDGAAALADTHATLHFTDARIDASDGCNRVTGGYTTTGDRFEIAGNLASTQMACAEPVMRQAAKFVSALRGARSARIDGGKLVLAAEDGTVLARFASVSQSLAGTSWEVTGYNNGKQAVVGVLAGTSISIAFGADGRVSGSAGCNRYTGQYTAAGDTINIGQSASTRRMCAEPAGIMEQEAAFLAALPGEVRARIDGDRLELRNAAGALRVAARAVQSSSSGSGDAATPPATLGLRLPATFRGDLPCADCEAIRYRLDLWPEGVFRLQREWLGRDTTRDVFGRWRADEARHAVELAVDGEDLHRFEVVGAQRLRALDRSGNRIVSQLPYELAGDGTLAAAEAPMLLGGDLRYVADAARFTECRTGHSYPVAMEADFPAIERAYRTAVATPGASVYSTFEGTIEARPKIEGDGTEATVVISRFIRAWPDESCERARTDAQLTNTYWRIVELGGTPVSTVDGRKEPRLLLREADGASSMSATVGCNTFTGSYEVDGDRFHFGPAAGTRMACPPPLDAHERALTDLLERTRSWRVYANTLELYGENRTPLALLQAVHL